MSSDIRTSAKIDPIVPVDFAPYKEQRKLFTLKFGWIHFFLVVFFSLSGVAAWYVLTARSVSIEVSPVTAAVKLEGGLFIPMGQRYLIRPGTYELTLENEGYHSSHLDLIVGDESAQVQRFDMKKLPGLVSVDSPDNSGARVQIDSVDIGTTPLSAIKVEPGEHQLVISKDRYLSYTETISVEGRSVEQAFSASLLPAWAVVSLNSEPAGAQVLVDGEMMGTTPLNAEILQGERDITVKLTGHKAWQEQLQVVAGEDFSIPPVILESADGLVFIQSSPSNAGVTIGGEFKGQTPLEVALAPQQRHEISLFKNGYQSNISTVTIEADEEKNLLIELKPVTATVRVDVQPVDAELYVNGEYRGVANQSIELMAARQKIEIRKDGFVPYTTEFTSRPGFDQLIQVSLKSLEQARLEQIKPVITSVAGQTLKLFYPTDFTMGASRREPGRRPNESLRDISLERPFYFGLTEVSNEEFRQFRKDHSSGTLQGQSMDLARQPAILVTWNDAALYCNWLSQQESLPEFYQVEEGKVTGFNPESIGYRLPSEAEWEWVARTQEDGSLRKFAWGDSLPPAADSGNIADLSSQSFLAEIVRDYEDGFLGTAPVGYYQANQRGVYDLGGNVSEWVHDIYGSNSALNGDAEVDPLGVEEGQFHTIRGSSWSHGSITELRLSFRDFGEEARDDLGFRIARYLEKPNTRPSNQ